MKKFLILTFCAIVTFIFLAINVAIAIALFNLIFH